MPALHPWVRAGNSSSQLAQVIGRLPSGTLAHAQQSTRRRGRGELRAGRGRGDGKLLGAGCLARDCREVFWKRWITGIAVTSPPGQEPHLRGLPAQMPIGHRAVSAGKHRDLESAGAHAINRGVVPVTLAGFGIASPNTGCRFRSSTDNSIWENPIALLGGQPESAKHTLEQHRQAVPQNLHADANQDK